jgi:hypothetical protein
MAIATSTKITINQWRFNSLTLTSCPGLPSRGCESALGTCLVLHKFFVAER